MAGVLLCAASLAVGQQQQPAGGAQSQGAAPQGTQVPGTALPRVTTTVEVRGAVHDNYLPEDVTVGSLTGEPLKSLPLSVSVVTRDLLSDQVARLLSDVVKNDASVEDDYVPVGYYGDYMIRGFPIDLATGIEINGLTIAGEQDVPLENKERVEILKGIAGLETGVAAAGGLVDYVTKRPAVVKAMDLATDQRGTAYGALDVGRFFAAQNRLGLRTNLGSERIMTYMNDTSGWRAVGAASADLKIDAATLLTGDFEYQHKSERDGSGYQLLGGTTLPDIHRIYRSTMLGDQPWGPADIYDTFNSSVRLDRRLSGMWQAFVEAGLSRSLIQDNVIYAYGCSYEAECAQDPGPGQSPAYFFAPDGTYDIYDYRDPGELRVDAVGEAMVTGVVHTGSLTHHLAAGGELFVRTVHQPGFYQAANPYSPDGVVQDGAVYSYIGSENIYAPMTEFPAPGNPASMEYPYEKAGPQRLWEDTRQSSGIVQDRVELPGRVQIIAGGRYDSLRDHNYSLYASCGIAADLNPSTASTPNPCAPQLSDKPVWLPQYAATYSPSGSWTLYGNYAVTLSLGPEAPWWVDNASQYLPPFFTRQAEVGARYAAVHRILLSGALFHMRAPFIYPRVIQAADSFCPVNSSTGGAVSPGDLCFEQQGRETHNGAELNAEGKVASWLKINASAAAMNAMSTNTGTAAFDNKQVLNVPHLHTSVFADVAIPRMRGLSVMPGWSYTSRKEATRDDSVSVPAVHVFNLGARYSPGGESGRVTFRVFANNILNRKYWSDTGANYGDTFVWLGAPTTVRLSAHYTF